MIRAITESSHWALRRAKYVTWKFRVWHMCPAGGFVGLLNEHLKSGLLERLVGCFGHRWRFSNERSSEDSLFNLSQVFWNWAIRFKWQAAMKLKFAFENTKRIRLKRIIQLLTSCSPGESSRVNHLKGASHGFVAFNRVQMSVAKPIAFQTFAKNWHTHSIRQVLACSKSGFSLSELAFKRF